MHQEMKLDSKMSEEQFICQLEEFEPITWQKVMVQLKDDIEFQKWLEEDDVQSC